MPTEPITFRNLSIHDRAPVRKGSSLGSSPDSVLDSSAHSPPRSISPSFKCQPDRLLHDPEVMRNPLCTINSEVFEFLDNGYIKGPGTTGYAGLVHNYNELISSVQGKDKRQILSAEWGKLVRPEPRDVALEKFRYGVGGFATKPTRRYVDEPLTHDNPPRRLSLAEMNILGKIRPEIALHGVVQYPCVTLRAEDGPFGTDSYTSKTITRGFTVRVPLEYALKRPVRRGLSSPTKKNAENGRVAAN